MFVSLQHSVRRHTDSSHVVVFASALISQPTSQRKEPQLFVLRQQVLWLHPIFLHVIFCRSFSFFLPTGHSYDFEQKPVLLQHTLSVQTPASQYKGFSGLI
jgi:hypothetical protein